MSYLENASWLQQKKFNPNEALGILIYKIEATNNFLKIRGAWLRTQD